MTHLVGGTQKQLYFHRINGLLFTVFKPYCCHCSLCLVVSRLDRDHFVGCLIMRYEEPNNASPLNPEAAGLWNNPTGEQKVDLGLVDKLTLRTQLSSRAS